LHFLCFYILNYWSKHFVFIFGVHFFSPSTFFYFILNQIYIRFNVKFILVNLVHNWDSTNVKTIISFFFFKENLFVCLQRKEFVNAIVFCIHSEKAVISIEQNNLDLFTTKRKKEYYTRTVTKLTRLCLFVSEQNFIVNYCLNMF
jgi:hypothetical protein